jgi:phage terminase large subunit-like protein
MTKIKRSELAKLSKDELLGIAREAQKIKEASKQRSIESYFETAHPDQLDFHKAAATHRIRYFSGGNRSGKSTAGFVEDIMLSLGIHPYIVNKTPNRGVVVVQDFENAAKNVLEVKYNEWCPPGSIERVEKNQANAWRKIFFKNGSTVDVLSHDQDMKVFEGSDYDWAHFDEPPPKHIYTAVWRGLTDRGGNMHMTATPLASPWLYQEYKKAIQGDPIRWFRFVKTTANAKNLGDGNIELGLKRIEEFGSMLSEEEKSARLDGMMVQMHGLVLKEFDRAHHLIPVFDLPPHWHIWETIDPHPHKPWAVCWIAVSESGKKILVRSLRAQGTLDEIADQILYERGQIPIRGGSRPRIVRCIIDNSSSVPLWQKSNTDPTIGRLSVREELENYIGPREGGPQIEVAPKNVAQKIDLFRRWLKIDETGESVFYVFDIEENEPFIFEIENYVWDSSRSKGLKNVPKKENDDCLDAVMQVALSLPKDAPVAEEYEPVRVWENKSWTVR